MSDPCEDFADFLQDIGRVKVKGAGEGEGECEPARDEPTTPIGRDMIAGLRDLADGLEAGKRLDEICNVTYVNKVTGERVAGPCPHGGATYAVATGRLTCNACGEELDS